MAASSWHLLLGLRFEARRCLVQPGRFSVWRVLLHPPGAPQARVELCDTGEGYSQVLPVLVALARAQTCGPRLVCLEQPELHLHTRAQAELAKQLVATAKSASQPRLMVETHSEVLLTSIQLAIAKGDLNPELVRVYWIEARSDGTSDAVPVEFDAQGRPNSSALSGAFGEAVRLGQDLLTKQLNIAKNEGHHRQGGCRCSSKRAERYEAASAAWLCC